MKLRHGVNLALIISHVRNTEIHACCILCSYFMLLFHADSIKKIYTAVMFKELAWLSFNKSLGSTWLHADVFICCWLSCRFPASVTEAGLPSICFIAYVLLGPAYPPYDLSPSIYYNPRLSPFHLPILKTLISNTYKDAYTWLINI